MQILTVDVGTGTQDIYLFESRLDIENGIKLVVPSPTMMVHGRIQEATRNGVPVLLTGVMMGGGPSQWAAEAHIKAGYPVYATPQAARTFNDDLDAVSEMGVVVISDDEATRLPKSILRLELRDFDFDAIARSLAEFGVSLNDLAAIAVAVFDHGDAPSGYSDRQFRFDYLDDRLKKIGNTRDPIRILAKAFAFSADHIPEIMTRLQAVALSARDSGINDLPLVVIDTAPAAVLGSLFDRKVQKQLEDQGEVLVANVGNFHTLAFRLMEDKIAGVFEHHTGLIDLPQLEALLARLADGSLKHEDVFEHHGHGALLYESMPMKLGQGDFDVAVTGPRRSLFHLPDNAQTDRPYSMRPHRMRPYFAVPFGDMMLAGCFGMLAATAEALPEFSDEIWHNIQQQSPGRAPWD